MKKSYAFILGRFLLITAVYARNCTYDPLNPLSITANTTWHTDRQVTSDVIIHNGATLTHTTLLEILPKGKVL